TIFGFQYTAVRDVAKNRDNNYEVSKIFSNVMTAKVFLMIISLIVLIVLIYSVPFLYEKRLMLGLTFLYIPGHILFPDWLFQALQKMRFVTFINVASKLLFTILVFLFIKKQEDYIYQPIFIAGGYLLSGGLSLYIVFSKFKIKFIFPKIA